jgi:hypothetical protein
MPLDDKATRTLAGQDSATLLGLLPVLDAEKQRWRLAISGVSNAQSQSQKDEAAAIEAVTTARAQLKQQYGDSIPADQKQQADLLEQRYAELQKVGPQGKAIADAAITEGVEALTDLENRHKFVMAELRRRGLFR